jgi:hypothetical protein
MKNFLIITTIKIKIWLKMFQNYYKNELKVCIFPTNVKRSILDYIIQ